MNDKIGKESGQYLFSLTWPDTVLSSEQMAISPGGTGYSMQDAFFYSFPQVTTDPHLGPYTEAWGLCLETQTRQPTPHLALACGSKAVACKTYGKET